jgi:hypothetical protein
VQTKWGDAVSSEDKLKPEDLEQLSPLESQVVGFVPHPVGGPILKRFPKFLEITVMGRIGDEGVTIAFIKVSKSKWMLLRVTRW